MARFALADALPDFGPRVARPDPQAGPAEEPAPAPQRAMPDPEDLVRHAVGTAEAALAARLAFEHSAAMEALRETHAAEMAALAQGLGAEAGALIERRMAALEEGLTAHASAVAARILGSVLSEELQKRSVAGLVASIREAARDGDALRIEVRGPQSLYESLRAALGGRADSLHFVEAPGFDLELRVDGELFETRLSEWSVALGDILS